MPPPRRPAGPIRACWPFQDPTGRGRGALAAQGQQAFGENYVQEALAKMQALQHLALEWHLIGHLQSNKAEAVATHFDWVQSVDRPKLVTLARHRPAARGPLNVLIQVNIDDESSKHGCAPEDVEVLAASIAAEPTLRLRGMMAIPAPWPEAERRRDAFVRMRTLFQSLAAQHAQVDTLSMGMSSDYADAIAEGRHFGAHRHRPVRRASSPGLILQGEFHDS